MKIAAAFTLLALALTSAVGCAQKDWIDRTLVTENVSGSWFGTIGNMEDLHLTLRQEGARVMGSFEAGGFWANFIGKSGAIDGTMTGDVLTFRDGRGPFRGEATISGDEMKGELTAFRPIKIDLHRVDPSAPPR